MWASEWGTFPGNGSAVAGCPSRLDPGSIELAYVLLWMEHCIECAIPECYSICTLYERRRDGKCARLRYGIYPNPAFRGLLDYGADVHFRRWGKLESSFTYGPTSPENIKRFASRDSACLSLLNPVAAALETVDPKRRLNGFYRLVRDYTLARATRDILAKRPCFDEFVTEVYNPNPEPVGLIVEVHQDGLRFRDSLQLMTGQNFHRIPFARMNVDLGRPEGRILVYPENDAEVRLIFTWLDFVRYMPDMRLTLSENIGFDLAGGKSRTSIDLATATAGAVTDNPAAEKRIKSAEKVKCVAWDLDNTVWNGILIEDGAESLTLKPGVSELIARLDERGILNTIVSKNDRTQAWARITEFGLDEYFVSPAINWGRKSENLKAVSEALNINIDTFAFIDDSPFERSEVTSELPQVRVFAETEMDSLIGRPEFDVPISKESKNRRFSYLAEDKRKTIAATFGDNYDEFLKSCKMQVILFHPEEPKHQDRALELIQRSNQLNLSTRRYSKEDFLKLLDDSETLSLAWSCKDRYGEYGTVGFMSISMGSAIPVLRDLVISCRVAKKKVENALFHWLACSLRDRGFDRLHALYLPNARNHVLLEALNEIGFMPVGERDGFQVLDLPFECEVIGGTIVQVEAPDVILPENRG